MKLKHLKSYQTAYIVPECINQDADTEFFSVSANSQIHTVSLPGFVKIFLQNDAYELEWPDGRAAIAFREE